MSEHTPEPWVMSTKADGNWWHISAGNQAIAAVHAASKKRNEPYASMFEANASRIIACVNACAGLPTEQLESSPLGGVLNGVAGLIAQRDELLAALELAESAYRLNVITDGEPSSILDAMQRAIAKAKGITAAEVDSCCP